MSLSHDSLTTTDDDNDVSSLRDSTTPLISPQQPQQSTNDPEIDPITGKRRPLKSSSNPMDPPATPSTQAAPLLKIPADLKPHPQPIAISPARHAMAASPSRLRSSSPRLLSPASNEIFERNVQEPVPMSTLQGEMSPAHIPTHVMTEDHIPAALEASAQAITSHSLNADEVEIVTSAAHQPAGASVLEGNYTDASQLHSPALHHRTSDPSEPTSLQHSGLLPVSAGEEEGATNSYGQLDPNDVRRLSFISFADVVQSEHNQQMADAGSRDSLHLSNLPNIASASDRATSPLRSPRSPASTLSGTGGVATPPPASLVFDPSIRNSEQSPVRSPGLHNPGQHGDLTIQTMRQAVRKTASGDLGSTGRMERNT